MTVTLAPESPRTFRAQVGWAIKDTWVITCRDLAHWRRQPGTVIANTLVFPVMIVLMFGYLMGGAMTVPGGGDYRDFLMPGMFAMTMVFGIGATLSAVSADAARGVTDRFRSLPMAAPAVIAGRAAGDMLNSAVALAVLTGFPGTLAAAPVIRMCSRPSRLPLSGPAIAQSLCSCPNNST